MKKTLILFTVLTALLYLIPLGVRDMFSPDETRYAEIGREMAVSGDWITPRLNGVLYFEKPILGYWAFAGAQKLFGENAFAVRLPCALATLLSALALFFLTRRFSGTGERGGLLAAAVFLLTPLVIALGVAATLDPVFSFFLTLSMVWFYYAVQARKAVRMGYLFLFGLAAGAAFLTKGFLAFALPGLSIFVWLAWNRRWKEMLTLPWIPLIGVLLVSLPWAVMIHLEQPEYWNYFIYDEHIKRFLEKEQHPEPFWFFIPVLFLGLGWMLFLVPSAVKGFARKQLNDDFVRYLICWFALPFLFLSLSSGKLATYILPCFAPLAVLFAMGLCRSVVERRDGKPLNALLYGLAGLLAVVAVTMSVIQLSGVRWALFPAGEGWKWWLFCPAGLLLAMALVFSAWERENPWRKLLFFFAGLCPLLFVMHFALPELVLMRKTACPLLERVKARISPETKLMSFRYPFQDVNWVFKTDDVYMYRAPGEISWGMERDPEMKKRRLLDIPAVNELIRQMRGKGGVLLVLPTKIYREDRKLLPEPEWVETNSGHRKGYSAVKF